MQNSVSAAPLRRVPPLHALLVPVPIVCFLGTLITDVVYWRTANMQWANMSAWMLAVGLVIGVVAVVAGLIDFLRNRGIRHMRAAWIHSIGYAVALVLSVINSFVHSRDAYTSVVPTGLVLSSIVVVILAVTAWNGWSMVYHDGVVVRSGDLA